MPSVSRVFLVIRVLLAPVILFFSSISGALGVWGAFSYLENQTYRCVFYTSDTLDQYRRDLGWWGYSEERIDKVLLDAQQTPDFHSRLCSPPRFWGDDRHFGMTWIISGTLALLFLFLSNWIAQKMIGQRQPTVKEHLWLVLPFYLLLPSLFYAAITLTGHEQGWGIVGLMVAIPAILFNAAYLLIKKIQSVLAGQFRKTEEVSENVK